MAREPLHSNTFANFSAVHSHQPAEQRSWLSAFRTLLQLH